jgi:hypothetical protein
MKEFTHVKHDDLSYRMFSSDPNNKMSGQYIDRQYGYDYALNPPAHWKITKIIPYLKAELLLAHLKRDLQKLEALKHLSYPEEYSKEELGFELVTGGEFGVDEGGIQSVINYVKNFIEVIETFIKRGY